MYTNIGVMIDDITTIGVTEPYRMFTGRSEFRISIRPDNADFRLADKALKSGAISQERANTVKHMQSQCLYYLDIINNLKIRFTDFSDLFKNSNITQPKNGTLVSPKRFLNSNSKFTILDLIKIFPKELGGLLENIGPGPEGSFAQRVSIEFLYTDIVKLQQKQISTFNEFEHFPFPNDFDYARLQFLCKGDKEKLLQFKPLNFGQASRVEGVSQSTIYTLLSLAKNNNYPKI